MRKKKIHQALEGLDIYQLNAFKKFILSPYFNQNEKITEYFFILESTIRKEKSLDDLDDQEIWKKISTEKYENVKFRKLSSDLYKLYEKFLSQQEFDRSSFHQLYLKSKASKKIKNDILNKNIDRLISLSNQTNPSVSANQILEKYLLNREVFGLKVEYEKKHKSYKGNVFDSLKILEEDLDKFYLIEKLRIYNTLLSWSKLNKVELNYNKFERFIRRIASNLFKDVPGIKIYNNIYHLLSKSEAHEKYLELQENIKEYKYYFELEELKDIYESAFTYGLGRLNYGDLEIIDQVLDLYKEALKDDVLLSDGKLSPTTFRNIVGIALRKGEYSWTAIFIQQYSKKLDEKYQENALNFNMARLHFYKKDYWATIESLQKVSYDDIWYNLNSRTISVLAYYELDEQEVLDSQLASFQVFIRREKSLGNRKNNYMNLIKLLKRLIRISPNRTSKLQQLKDQVIETKGVVNKQWLLEKIEEKLN